MPSISVTRRDVIVVLRHDPGSSDVTDIAVVWDRKLFSEDDQIAERDAELQAIDREIRFIKDEAQRDSDEQVQFANSLTRDNLTKKTDVWFQPIIMPVIEEVLNAAV